ncbi:MAG: tetratricopeptide repeat protein [Desulfomicrobium sp.]
MQWLRSLLGLRDDHADLFSPVPPNPAQDALAAIDDLSRAMRNHQGAVEICSALGNLYRMRGELDRAIQMRSSLLQRPDLGREDQGRILFELGRDYSRAGILDRAEEAMRQSRDIGGDTPALELEMALLHAKGGDFLAASRQYKKMGHHLQAAHYLVRAATSGTGVANPALLAEARDLYPASPEAWLEGIMYQIGLEAWDEVLTLLDQGLEAVGTHLGFVLLDPLLDFEDSGVPVKAILPAAKMDGLLSVIESHPPDIAPLHYAGCLLRAHGRVEEAKTWQEKALLMSPAFWPARLELLTMSLPEQRMTPVFELQLEFLLRRAREAKRFVCGRCGLKRGQIFFCCPKCMSWHSITIRQLLSDEGS